MEENKKELELNAFKEKIQKGAVIIDTRDPVSFTEGFIPGAISIGLKGHFEEWAGRLLPKDKKLLLIATPGEEAEALNRMERLRPNGVTGYLKGGMNTWRNAGENIDLVVDVEADELALDIPYDNNLLILDVREKEEFNGGHVKEALNIPLSELTDPLKLSCIEEDHNLYIHCQSGYRSVIACSLIKKQGYHNLRNVLGGFKAIREKKGEIKIVSKTSTILND